MKTRITDALQIIVAILITGSTAYAMQPPTEQPTSHSEASQSVEVAQVPVSVVQEAPVESPKPVEQIQTQVAPEPVPEPTPVAPVSSGDCASELSKYNWNQQSAYDVMMQESGNKPDNHNDNASTGDYSIGCFQINLKGYDNVRAKYRDSVIAGYTGPATVEGLEPWLKVARNNVNVAWIMWRSSGWEPWSNHTCKVVRCI